LPNTPLTKNQKLKKYLKAVFEKHALRKKYCVFSLIKIKAKHGLKLINTAQPRGLGFLAQA
jgi:hypothetical protein